jgi:hypothetical protein
VARNAKGVGDAGIGDEVLAETSAATIDVATTYQGRVLPPRK